MPRRKNWSLGRALRIVRPKRTLYDTQANQIGGNWRWLGFLALAAFIALTALEDNIVFFRSPSELAAQPAAIGEAIRIGGLVREGSVTRDGLRADFQVTDLAHDIAVSYEGMLPDLFREGQGLSPKGALTARVYSAPIRCWPSMTKPICRPRWLKL